VADPPDLNKLLAALEGFYAQVAQAPTPVNEGLRQQLAGMTAQIRGLESQLKTEYPRGMSQLEAQREETRKRSQATLDQLAQMRQQVEAAKQAQEAPAPPEPTAEPFDASHGRTLRDELLARFGGPRGEAPPPGQGEDSALGTIQAAEFTELLKKKGLWK
jgi:hypothetical protein